MKTTTARVATTINARLMARPARSSMPKTGQRFSPDPTDPAWTMSAMPYALSGSEISPPRALKDVETGVSSNVTDTLTSVAAAIIG